MDDPGFKSSRTKQGWLRKQGGKMRGWQRRYFELNENWLYCRNREDDIRPPQTYLLDEYHIKESPSSLDDPDKFPFELVAEKSGESLTLCAASEEERKEWLKILRFNRYSGKGGAIFGTPLAVTMKYEHKQGRIVPYIVQICIEHLTNNAMEAEGIFRLAGRAGLMRELRNKFEVGQHPSLDEVDIHTVGSLLKTYLRELPESLIPPNLYQRAMNFAMRYQDASSDEVRAAEVAGLANLLEDLPDINYCTLAYLCRFLSRLAANSEKTKMDAHNLSLVFGPNIIRHLDDNPELLMLTADLTQHLAYMLIHHCSEILPHMPSREVVPSTLAADSPQLRKRNPVMQSVATADLLRMSQPLESGNPALLVPRPAALGDLVGLDFSSQQDEVFHSSHSPSSPLSPFQFVSNHFDLKSKSLSDKENGSTSSEAGGSAGSLDRNRLGPGPVPPKRTKSRTLKARRPGSGLPSPMSSEPSRQLDTGDIMKALASVNVGDASQPTQGKSNASETSTSDYPPEAKSYGSLGSKQETDESTKHCTSLEENTSTSEFYVSAKSLSSESSNGTYSHSVTVGSSYSITTFSETTKDQTSIQTGPGKVSPSEKDLHAQVFALKSELVGTKTRSERMMTALKNQLVEIRTKYEARITSLQKQHETQIQNLQSKLEAERNSCQDAVARTVSLQSQLLKYKLQFGELRDSQ